MKRLALAFLVAAAATSCTNQEGFTPTPISFANHPSILRGTWSGPTKGAGLLSQNLRLKLSATYLSGGKYRVSGTGTLGAAALNVTGEVFGGSRFTYLQPQLSPAPDGADLVLQRAGKADLNLSCSVRGEDAISPTWRWECFAKDGSFTVLLKKEVQ